MGKMMKKTIPYLLVCCMLAGTFAVTAAAAGAGQTLFDAAAPYEIVVLLVNTLIHHGMKPLYSICVSSFVQSAVVTVSALLTVVFLARQDRKRTKSEAAQ